jgi:hypothetical protein
VGLFTGTHNLAAVFFLSNSPWPAYGIVTFTTTSSSARSSVPSLLMIAVETDGVLPNTDRRMVRHRRDVLFILDLSSIGKHL